MKLRGIIMGHETLPMEERVGENTIGYVMSTTVSNFKCNGKERDKSKYVREEAKDESIVKVRVGDSKTVREKAASDSVKDTVGNIQERVTYADVVLKGKKKKQ